MLAYSQETYIIKCSSDCSGEIQIARDCSSLTTGVLIDIINLSAKIVVGGPGNDYTLCYMPKDGDKFIDQKIYITVSRSNSSLKLKLEYYSIILF